MEWNGKKVLVTGAAGFIGSHLTERLVELGADVTCFVRYNSRDDMGFIEHLRDSGKVKVIRGDIIELETVREIVKGQEIIFYLSASISVPYSMEHPSEVVKTNILGTLNLLSSCREENVKKILITSSSEVYGTAQYVPIDEKHPLQAQSPYAASKIAADKIAESFYNCYKLPIVIVRPFNSFGPRQSSRAVIPSIIHQVLTKDKILVGTMETYRDFNYVGDIVNGFIKAAESDKAIGEVINIGSGVQISIKDMIQKVIRLVGRDVSIVLDKKRLRPNTSEVMRLCAGNSKAKKLLSWEPQVPFEEGLQKTIDWISEHKEDYKSERYIT